MEGVNKAFLSKEDHTDAVEMDDGEEEDEEDEEGKP